MNGAARGTLGCRYLTTIEESDGGTLRRQTSTVRVQVATALTEDEAT